MKVLVIDDSSDITEAVSLCVSLRWPLAEILSAPKGQDGLDILEQEVPDVIILDIGLPDMKGLDVLRRVREFSDIPVVMLTARDGDVEIARYLEEGADDYIVKPFSHVELLGRIQAILRRSQGRAKSAGQPFQSGDLFIDFEGAEVLKNNEPILLTRSELSILEVLVRNAGRVVTYEALAARALRLTDPSSEANTRLVRVHVQHIRNKLGDDATNPKYIVNVYGSGYKFIPAVSVAASAGIDSQVS